MTVLEFLIEMENQAKQEVDYGGEYCLNEINCPLHGSKLRMSHCMDSGVPCPDVYYILWLYHLVAMYKLEIGKLESANRSLRSGGSQSTLICNGCFR